MSIRDLYGSVDEFWQRCGPWWQQQVLASGARKRRRATRLHPSEIMPIAILFQQSHSRTFKAYYTEHVQQHWRAEFPQLVSYSRCVELLPTVLVPLLVYLQTQLGHCTASSFVDSTALAVCHTARIRPQRVFNVDARCALRAAARRRSAGSRAASSTWSSTIGASCWPFA